MGDPQTYQTLYEISRQLHRQTGDLHRALQTVVSAAGDALGISHGCLLTFRGPAVIDNVYVLGAQAEVNPQLWSKLLKLGLVGYAYHSGRTVVVRNIQTDPRWSFVPGASFLLGHGSAVAAPLKQGDELYGVLLLMHPRVDYFSRAHVTLLNEICQVAALAVGNALDLYESRTGSVRYQALFDDAVVPIILTDPEGYVIDANHKACDFLQYRRSELLEMRITDLHHGYPVLNDEDISQLSHGEERTFRATIATAEGAEIPTLVRVRRLDFGGREVLEWIEQDLTAQMELEQLRRDLTAMVYHDLRGPLNNILASIYKVGDLLQDHQNPALRTLLQLGLRSTRQLQRMVDSLLDIQRLESNNNILNCEPVDVQTLLPEAVQLVQPIATEGGQHIQLDIAGDLPQVHIDSDMVMRVAVNLMENAIKYTPGGGVIQVRAARHGEQVLVSVSDSGPGIPAQLHARIFDKYSRVKYRDAPKGIGLGLAFCRLAVEAHGGQIWVESKEGRGSVFSFTLPLHRADSDSGEADESDEPGELATA